MCVWPLPSQLPNMTRKEKNSTWGHMKNMLTFPIILTFKWPMVSTGVSRFLPLPNLFLSTFTVIISLDFFFQSSVPRKDISVNCWERSELQVLASTPFGNVFITPLPSTLFLKCRSVHYHSSGPMLSVVFKKVRSTNLFPVNLNVFKGYFFPSNFTITIKCGWVDNWWDANAPWYLMILWIWSSSHCC